MNKCCHLDFPGILMLLAAFFSPHVFPSHKRPLVWEPKFILGFLSDFYASSECNSVVLLNHTADIIK